MSQILLLKLENEKKILCCRSKGHHTADVHEGTNAGASTSASTSKEWQLWWKANPKVAGWYCLTTSGDRSADDPRKETNKITGRKADVVLCRTGAFFICYLH